MKTLFIVFLFLFGSLSFAGTDRSLVSAYFERPLNCPLRFSNLSQLRDQIQTLTSSLGNECSQSGQQSLNQLRTSLANLEGIANSFSTFQGTDQKAQNVQLARNANQVLGSLNIITSNNACFYDIRSRGALPVLSDIIMSISQVGLLVPSSTGILVATGGYIAGSGMKIINELVKKKFNWNKPEERRAFLQLNCAFFDNRRMMEEAGLFNPETKTFRTQLLHDLKQEREQLLRVLSEQKKNVEKLERELNQEIRSIPEAKDSGVSFELAQKLDELLKAIGTRPADIPSKLRQASHLSKVANYLDENLGLLRLDDKDQHYVGLMHKSIKAVLPEIEMDGKVWTSSIDEYENRYRGPIVAFAAEVLNAVNRRLREVESKAAAESKDLSKKLSELKIALKESRWLDWGASQRLISIEARIESLETFEKGTIFSQDDPGKSDSVEILDYYRKLQRSILGKEGMGYLKNSLNRIEEMQDGLEGQLYWFDQARSQSEKCAAAEKLRFAWAEFRYKVQESHDFVETNMDLFRASFKIGRQKQRRATRYVLEEITSVQNVQSGSQPEKGTLGYFMNEVKAKQIPVEKKLEESACF